MITATVRAGIKTLLDSITGFSTSYLYEPDELLLQEVPCYYIRKRGMFTESATTASDICYIGWEVVMAYEHLDGKVSVIDSLGDEVRAKLRKRGENLGNSVINIDTVEDSEERTITIGGKRYLSYAISFRTKVHLNNL